MIPSNNEMDVTKEELRDGTCRYGSYDPKVTKWGTIVSCLTCIIPVKFYTVCSEFPVPAVTCGCSNNECPGDQKNLK